MRLMVARVTPNSTAISSPEYSPDPINVAMASTCKGVNVGVLGLRCGPFLSRALACRSRLLSARVPMKRWSGRTQWRTSHLWRRQRGLAGNVPWVRSQATLCARIERPSHEVLPYPLPSSHPVHNQHWSVRSIFAQNRASLNARLGLFTLTPTPLVWHSIRGKV